MVFPTVTVSTVLEDPGALSSVQKRKSHLCGLTLVVYTQLAPPHLLPSLSQLPPYKVQPWSIRLQHPSTVAGHQNKVLTGILVRLGDCGSMLRCMQAGPIKSSNPVA